MTKEEAKDILLDRKELSSPELANALEIAIYCIEKQIPQKVDMYGNDYADGEEVIEYYDCPRCGKEYVIEDDGFLKYCSKCGQALK